MYQLGATDEEILQAIKSMVPSTRDKLSPVAPIIDALDIPDKTKVQLKSKTIANSLDVMLLGPALIYAGTGRKLPRTLGSMLVLTGMGTILVNLGKLLEDK